MAKSEELCGIAADDRGFSLIELVVALALLGIIFGAALPAMNSAMNLGRNNRNRSVAADLASQAIDLVRQNASTSAGFQALTAGTATTQSVVGSSAGVSYTVSQTNQWVASGATSNACTGPTTANPQYIRVSVAVTWPNMSGAPSVKTQTLLAPPTGTYSPYSGAIALNVTDQGNQPVGGVTVAATAAGGGPAVPSQVTASDGCAYFAFLAVGNYTVTLSKSGYVDGQGNPTATTTTGVSLATASLLSLSYDVAGTLAPAWAGNATPSGAVPAGLPLTVADTNLTPSGTAVQFFNGVPQWGNLFPYSSGYMVWAGGCAASDPSFYSHARPAAVNVPAGGTTPVALTLQSVDVKVVHATGGAAISGESLSALNATDAVCATQTSYPITGTTAVTTGILRVALPLGTWTFSATGAGGSGTGGSISISQITTAVPTATVSI